MKKVSVVIPVYGQWDLVKRNVDSLLNFDNEFINEILVSNDCSPEPNPYHFDERFVKVINNEKNLGYSGTANNALKSATSEIIVLLDSDAYAVGPFIQKLIEMYSHNPSAGCIGFGTIDNLGKDTGNFQYQPSVLGFIFGQQLQSRFEFFKFWRNKKLLVNCCAVSFRKTCLEEVGFFDEDDFPVLEADVDLCMRIQNSKWDLIFTREIIICHYGGHSIKVNYKRVLLYHSSRWKLLKKYGFIPFPVLVKVFLKGRVKLELLIMKFLNFIYSGNHSYPDKIKGRKILLKEVDLY